MNILILLLNHFRFQYWSVLACGLVVPFRLLAGEIQITKAQYGAEESWTDVTAIIRAQEKDGIFKFKIDNSLLGDPAPARLKQLQLTVSDTNRTYNLSLDEDTELTLDSAYLRKIATVQAPESLQKTIEDAYQRGEHSITLKPSVYHITPRVGQEIHLRFSNMKDFTINATGSTLVFEKAGIGLVFENCRRVSFRGATLTRQVPPFSQGDIVAIASDRSWLDIKIHDGYPKNMDDPGYKPSKTAGGGILTLFAQGTGILKKDVLDLAFQIKSITPVGGNTFRFQLKSPFDRRMPLQIGDMAAWRKKGSSQVAFLNCAEMSFTDVTITNSSLLAIFEGRGDGGNYYRYKVTYAAPPQGSTRKPLLSSAADGFNSADVRKGATLENCLWEGLHDDAVNIHASMTELVAGEGDHVIANYNARAPYPRQGDKIQFFDAAYTLQAEASFVGLETLPDYQPPQGYQSPRYANPAKPKFIRLKFDHSIPVQRGWYMANASASGAGYVIRNCVTRDHRARGFLLYSADGLVENCLIERCSYAGIAVAPSLSGWGEGPFASNLIIRNNTFREVGIATEPWNNCLTIGSSEKGRIVPLPGGHRNILIEGNRFENNDGPNIMVNSAIGVKIRDNLFIKPMNEPYHGLNSLMNTDALVVLAQCREVDFSGNKVITPGPFMKRLVDLGPATSATGIATGFVVEK